MKLLYFILALSFCLISCGGGGGGGAVALRGQSLFEEDMLELSRKTTANTLLASPKSEQRAQMLFGASRSQRAIDQFVRTRVSQTFLFSEFGSVRVSLGSQGGPFTELLEEADAIPSEGVQGFNFAFWQYYVANGEPLIVSAGNFSQAIDRARPNVIFVNDDLQETPPEYRVGIYVHEGRHSDCSSSNFNTDLCHYSHTVCGPGEEFPGQEACDDIPWGSYGVGAAYFELALGFANLDSRTEFILQQSLNSSLGRLSRQALREWDDVSFEADLDSL